MSGLLGADVEALQRLASELDQGAAELRELSRQLAASIDATQDWQGPDAVRCKDEWGTFAHDRMTGVSDALETAGRLLSANAEEQERASAVEQPAPAPGYGVWSFLGDVLTLKNLVTKPLTAITKAKALVDFLRALSVTNLAEIAASERLIAALDVFRVGKGAGLLGALGLPRLGMLLGRAFLPLTVVGGAVDIFTGGGREGWRGWATRGFGLAGAAGAATLLVGGAALVASAPITATVAAVAVGAYTVWSAGNYVYDHWGSIKQTGSRALEAAKGWARGLLNGGPRLGQTLEGALG